MLTKTRAVVLRTLKYGESQVIVDTFTESHGRLSFIQHIHKTSRAKVKKQLFQPLSIIDISFDFRPKAKLQRASEASLACPFTSIPFDGFKLSIALFVAEFTLYCTRAEQRNEPMFRYIVSSVMWLDARTEGFSNFHIVYMMRLSRFIGFFPNLNHDAADDYFDLRNGCFSPDRPAHPDYLQPAETKKIGLLMRMRYETMHLFSFSHNERNRCVEIVLKYYRLHIPDFPDLNSLSVLRDVYA